MKKLTLLLVFILMAINGYSAYLSKVSYQLIPGDEAIYGQKADFHLELATQNEHVVSNSAKNNVINSAGSSVSDSLALIALYNQCDGTNWTKKDNWLTGRLDTWQGVTVENGRVVGLNLGDPDISVGLNGPIPNELSNLTEIRTLNLANNQLTGQLPTNWSSLVKLESLNLEQNQLVGSLPESWSTLVKLSWLNLQINQIDGNLPDSWSSMVNLRWISILGNKISGNLPVSWSALVNLGSIFLSGNQLTGSLPVEWSVLKNLDTLILENNQLSGTLPDSWSALVKMTVLSIGGNQLTGTLPLNWSTFVNLYLLNLSNNHLTGTLPANWSSLVRMADLSLTNNQFTGPFPASWSQFINIKQLQINNNQISDLPPLPTFSALTRLTVENNLLDFGDIEPNIGISSETYNYSPQAKIGKVETIVKNLGEECRISVSVGGTSNKYQWFKDGIPISGATSAEYVIPSVTISDAANYACKITNTVATELTLSSNPITLQVLNNTFDLNSDSLALVALYNQCNGPNWTRKKNWLTGRLVTWQGVFLENGRVIGLELSDNSNPENSVGLTGNLPAELANLTAIQFINFRNNKLTGNLSDSWSVFKNLKKLQLQENQFSGNLPESWSAMENLVDLDLGNNNLTGTLPTTWSALQNLETIILSQNHLSGDLPVNWSMLNKLQILYLSHNQLTGTLPKNWSSLENLVAITIGNNQLTGNLPEEWKSLLKIESIQIYGNQLTGNLPDSWSSLIKLRDIKLYSNHFTGTLPESWSSFKDMMQLMLNNNQFSGSYPESWKSFSNLQYLYLNDNQIANLPELSSYPLLDSLYVENNRLDFGDIEPNISIPKVKYTYSPQAKIGLTDTIVKKTGEEFRISVVVGGKSNKYQWFKNGIIINVAIGAEFIITSVTTNDSANYTCQITNTVATQLTLISNPITLQVQNQTFSANAGLDQTVNEGTVVSLDGSLSYDPAGNPLTYKWTAPSGITLSSASGSKPTFTAPKVVADTSFTFFLIVNNGTLDSPADQVLITVLNVNKAPVANAGIDQSVKNGAIVSLDGSASKDTDGNQLTYQWTAPDGITLSSVSDSMPTFTAPIVKSDTIYTFLLIVNDGLANSPVDLVTITVHNTDKQLLIDAGPDQYIYERSTVSLDGSASFNLNKKPLTYKWTAPSEITLSSYSVANPTFTAPEVNLRTEYIFSLVVNDGTEDSPIDEVTVTILDVIRVYPNITTGIVNIEFNIGTDQEPEILVLNLLGQEILRNEVTSASKFQIDLSNQADEVYIILLQLNGRQYFSKVILRKN